MAFTPRATAENSSGPSSGMRCRRSPPCSARAPVASRSSGRRSAREKVRGQQQRRERERGGGGEPQHAHRAQRGVGRIAFADHRLGLARHAVGEQPAQVAALRHAEQARQRIPGRARVGAGLQRPRRGHRALQVVEAARQHRDRVLALQVLGPPPLVVVELDRARRQRAQPGQRRAHVGLQAVALRGVGVGVELHLRDPGAQPLLGRRELHEAELDVARDPAPLHVALGRAQRPHGERALQHGGGGQHGEGDGQALAEHSVIVGGAPRRNRKPEMNAG
jgi:hypothetical protein